MTKDKLNEIFELTPKEMAEVIAEYVAHQTNLTFVEQGVLRQAFSEGERRKRSARAQMAACSAVQSAQSREEAEKAAEEEAEKNRLKKLAEDIKAAEALGGE